MFKLEKTEYVTFKGTVLWCKPYKPDDFAGTVNWKSQLVMTEDSEWDKFNKYFLKKTFKEDDNGKHWTLKRPTTKLIKGKLVYFTPPIIYGKGGEILAAYVDENDQIVRSYEDASKQITKIGERPLIANGSAVEATLVVYPTAMGPGSRWESLKVTDLITYVPPAEVSQDDRIAAAKKEKAEVELDW